MRNNQPRSRTIQNIDAVAIALLVMIFLAILIRIINPVFYNLNYQHDPHIHIAGLISLINGQIPSDYAPPVYLAWYLIHALIPYFLSGFMTPDQQMKAFVGLGNLTLFLGLLLGLYFLGKRLGLSTLQILLWLALTGSMVPLHRSLNMVRPENIQLALSPWIFLTGMNWFREMERRGAFPINFQFIVFQLLCAVEIFQKIGGAAVLITSYFSLLVLTKMNTNNFRNVIISSFVTAIIFVTVVAGWYQVSGNFAFDPHRNAAKDPQYDHSAPLSFFTSFPMTKFLKTPFRDELRTSMASIFLSDFYGDYGRYGYNHYKFTLPPNDDSNMLFRQRLGSIVSLTFFLILAAICIYIGKEAMIKKADRRRILQILILGLLPCLFGLIYLGLFSQIQFHPGKANIVKWEYILFAIPFLLLPMVHFVCQLKDKWLRIIYYLFCFFLIVFGITQSLYIL
jgi:hypothetical protein